MTRYYVLTNWVTVMDWEGHHVAARKPDARRPAIYAEIKNDRVLFFRDDTEMTPLGCNEHGDLVECHPNDVYPITATPAGHHEYWFSLNDIYLCASPDRHVKFCSARPITWETFRLISEDDYDALAYFCGNDWYSKGSDQVFETDDIHSHDQFTLSFNNKTMHVRDIILTVQQRKIFENTDFPKQLRITHNHWQQDTLHLYKPAIYYCAFHKPESFACLTLSMNSLRNYGKYSGDIIVVTEKTDDYLRSNCPSLSENNAIIQKYLPIDVINFMSARFDAEKIPSLSPFQPILYMDLDTLVHQDIAPLLQQAVARTETNFFVFSETDAPETGSIWGRDLFNDDGRPPQDYGLTTGIMMYRNLHSALPALTQIRRVVRGQATTFGVRYMERIFDQPIANYVLQTQETPDTTLLTSACINKGEWDMLASDAAHFEGVVASLQSKTIIHFAGGVGAFNWKLPAMERYFAKLSHLSPETPETLPAIAVEIPNNA